MLKHCMILIALLIASYTDWRKREIPLFLFPSIAILFIFKQILFENGVSEEYWTPFLILIAFQLPLCIRGKLGGGDLIMLSCISLIIGVYEMMFLVFIISIVSLCVLIVYGKVNAKIPLAPIVMISYLIFLYTRFFLVL